MDRFPNLGTAARVSGQLALPAVLGGGYALAGGDPDTAAKIAAVTWAAPKAGAFLMTRPGVQNYLASGLGSPIVRNALMAPSQGRAWRGGAGVPARAGLSTGRSENPDERREQ